MKITVVKQQHINQSKLQNPWTKKEYNIVPRRSLEMRISETALDCDILRVPSLGGTLFVKCNNLE